MSESDIQQAAPVRRVYQKIGFVAGPLVALFIGFYFETYFEIGGLSPIGVNMLALVALMAIWWASEAIPVSVTALLPLLFMPILGIESMPKVAATYMHPISFLFLGGFTLALAIERSGLHIRIAYTIFRLIGLNARYIVAGFMGVAAFTSMWISNTSTTLMILPIALSITHVIRKTFTDLSAKEINDFEVCMFLGLAHGATLGGIATLIGTPPNAFAAGFVQSQYGIELDFVRWMAIGVPLMLVMLPIVWLVLTKFLHPVRFIAPQATKAYIDEQAAALGPLTTAEKRVIMVFAATVAAWLFRKPLLALFDIKGISDTSIAMLAMFALFIIPSGKNQETLMVWEDTKKLPWGILLLFGGGFAIAAGMTQSGLSGWIGAQLAPLNTISIAALILIACMLVIFLTEITSNTATTTTFLPVVAALSLEIGQAPLVLIVPVTLAASFAFMFPVATPPNTIVFGSGKIRITQMIRAGFVLNIISVFVLTLFAVYFIPHIMLG
ncbi:MAG: DASS family sodium-coupled anion symporter [Alphaproteobacteria bacterium]|nr:DASS family sodium-coupled anion symporter [Alphaproteobacteria bacterium]